MCQSKENHAGPPYPVATISNDSFKVIFKMEIYYLLIFLSRHLFYCCQNVLLSSSYSTWHFIWYLSCYMGIEFSMYNKCQHIEYWGYCLCLKVDYWLFQYFYFLSIMHLYSCLYWLDIFLSLDQYVCRHVRKLII